MFGSPEAAIDKTFQLRGMPITIVGTFKESVDTFGMSEVADETILIPIRWHATSAVPTR